MKSIMLIGCLCLLLTGAADKAWGAHPLSDEEMDLVTAGTLSVAMSDGKLSFQLGGDKGSGLSIEGSGTISTVTNPAPAGPPAYIIMRDNAQSNLHAFVNVNAVNANVQVLINLIVNINSTVGAIHQINSAPAL
ncbi:MAG: hypothetical protein FD174_2199 [Geobacteraceae bacterium]|nr:MAG: hypothetical protein FD174_2199 [Geobacteraceae bacterium]